MPGWMRKTGSWPANFFGIRIEMSGTLLDVNVLLALAWPSHAHHEIADEWFLRNRHKGWATCVLTQLAFLRLSSLQFSSSPG